MCLYLCVAPHLTVYHEQLAKTPVATVCDPIFFWYGKWLSQDAQPNDKQNPSLPNTCSGFVLRLGFWGPNTSSRLVFGSLGEVFHQVQYLKSTWHSPYILVYIDPLLTYLLDPFGICAIYFDLKVQGIFKIPRLLKKVEGSFRSRDSRRNHIVCISQEDIWTMSPPLPTNKHLH